MQLFNCEQCGKFGTRYEHCSLVMTIMCRKPSPQSKIGYEEAYKNEKNETIYVEAEKLKLPKGYV